MRTWLMPTFGKIILALVLFFIVTSVTSLLTSLVMMDYHPTGVPFTFLETWGPCLAGSNCSKFNNWALAGDVIVWYLVSASILYWRARRQIRK